MGVSEGECPVAVVVHGRDEAGAAAAVADLLDPAETLGDYDETLVRAFFDVSERELAATAADLPTLVRERVALLVVER
jgi:KEOPS complex subunit Cgi121